MNPRLPMRIVYTRLFVSAIVIAALLAIGAAVPAKPTPDALAHAARMAHP